MKNLIILAVFVTALFGCSKNEEVRPVVPVVPVNKPVTTIPPKYYINNQIGYFASINTDTLMLAKSKSDYEKGIFIIPKSWNVKFGYVFRFPEMIVASETVSFNTQIRIQLREKNSNGLFLETSNAVYTIVK
jgi:hypothetical protein